LAKQRNKRRAKSITKSKAKTKLARH
jgi:hypothetical protein